MSAHTELTSGLAAGEFEIEQIPEDVWRAYRHGFGAGFWYMIMITVGVLWTGLFDLNGGGFGFHNPTLILGAVVFWAILGFTIYKTARTRRRYRVRVTDEHITVSQDTGDVRLAWSALTGIKEAAGIYTLRSQALAIALPWYRLSPVQQGVIRDSVARHAPKAQKQKSKVARTLVLWVVLVLMFVVIYNVVNKP